MSLLLDKVQRMSVNNRQRRAAKAKQRATRARTGPVHPRQSEFDDSTSSREFRLATASLALRELVFRRRDRLELPDDMQQFARHELEYQQLAIDRQLLAMVDIAVAGGWNPHDLREMARRRVSEPVSEHLLGAVAQITARHNRSMVDAEWLALLHDVQPAASSQAWATAHRLAWPAALDLLIDLLVTLAGLPKIEEVIPRPGSRRAAGPAARGVDERILRKVRALLAKAEATDFDAEADALTAKAQQLMTAHAIERALADAGEPVREAPTVRRVWLDPPYVDGKALLVNEVAASNRVRCVLTKACGFVTLVGFQGDLDTVELLSTSLLVQATRAMQANGSQVNRYGTSRTRSFRQSFLASFAVRIGERLRSAATEVEDRADRGHAGALVPVLSARDDAVQHAAEALFPELVSKPIAVSNQAGWTAGRVAADLASLDVRDAIDRAG
jgi:Protein of unknown function (DUF2786)